MSTDSKNPASGRGDYHEQWAHISPSITIMAEKDYIVFIDQDNDLDWETTQTYDELVKGDPRFEIAAHNGVLNEAARLETTPCEGLSTNTQIQFKRLIGEAISCSFDHDYANARKMLSTASGFVRARSEETSRRWYLSASFGSAAIFSAFGLVIWVGRSTASAILSSDGMWLTLSCVAGAIGALLSVIWRSGKLKFDCSAGWKLHRLEGASRICAGAISGLVVALAIRSGLILTALTHVGTLHQVMLLAAIAGGSGERFATSIITKFETSTVKASR